MLKKTLLITDDDIALNNLLATFFKTDYDVLQAFDGEDGIDKFENNKPDLILLDVMMPNKDGIEMLKYIRQTSRTPVLMLSAKGEDIDKIIGLELGADDYVTKPCHPRELAARVKNLLTRRPESHLAVNVDRIRRQISIDDEVIKLTNIEYEILTTLYQSMLKTMSKHELYEHVFQREMLPFDRALDVHISNIRKKISHTSINIQTVRGKGYRLCPYRVQ